MYEVHGEGYVIVYRDVCLRYRVRETILCTVCMSEVHGEGYDILYRDVCMMYRVRDMILCRMMCV